MRITNNMMLRTSSSNINGNKVNVNSLQNQMSSQKKIQRPSEDPVIAIRALRFRSTLSEIDQYYENNIPDAESWFQVTETAIKNMIEIVTDVRSQCVYGSNDPLTADDRNTILTSLEKLRDQVYAEGNTDYAGRTVFTGYRTNQKLTFMEDDQETCYNITQSLTFEDITEYRYYNDEVVVPTTEAEVLNEAAITNPTEAIYDRIRLSYSEIDSITDANGNVIDGTNVSEGEITYTNADGTTGTLQVTMYDTLVDWAAADPNGDGSYVIDEAAGETKAVFIKETGELILGDNASSTIRAGKAGLDLNYTKTGFDKGELRPEYYYNCTDITDPVNPIDFIKYENGQEVYQDIEYVVAANQTMVVNTSAINVFDASLSRDVDELIEAVRFAQEANDKVAQIENMMTMQEYASDDCQAMLESWLEAAEKERDYADDNMQKLYNTYIGNCDHYLENLELAETDIGSKGASLELIKNRMSNQQTIIETLKSTNEDRDLSEIIIDYTAAYTAYEASLQAASKINQNTLLNFI